MRDRFFREDENELPYLVSSKRDDYSSEKLYNSIDSSKLYDSAGELLDEGKLDEALTLINILIDRNPDDDRYWNIRAIIYADIAKSNIFNNNQYDESIKCYNIAIKLNSMDYTLKKNKALTLIEYADSLFNQNEYVSAIHKLDEALPLLDENKIDKDTFATAWNLKGMCHHKMGNIDAFKCYDEALKYAPDNETIKQNKKDLRYYQGIDNDYFYE